MTERESLERDMGEREREMGEREREIKVDVWERVGERERAKD